MGLKGLRGVDVKVPSILILVISLSIVILEVLFLQSSQVYALDKNCLDVTKKLSK